jgi:hypothetical protein
MLKKLVQKMFKKIVGNNEGGYLGGLTNWDRINEEGYH